MKSKAYGKILIFGAYSILEKGNLGYVATINKGTTTDIKETDSGKLIIDLSNYNLTITGEFKNKLLRFNNDHSIFNFVKKAVDYSFQYLIYKKIKINDIKLLIISDPEFSINNLKTGLGSSSTSVVSTVASILALHNITDRDIVFKISRYAHIKAQDNLGSGYDIAAACYGSHFFISDKLNSNLDFFDYINQKDNYIKKEFEFNLSFLPVLIFLNRSVSTKEYINKAFDFKNKNKKEYDSFMFEYNQINNYVKEAFEVNDMKKIKHYLELSWQKRKEFGKLAKIQIETDEETDLINKLKQNGAYLAGVIGAGGDSILALCNSSYDKKRLIEYLDKKNYNYLEISFSNKGYEIF